MPLFHAGNLAANRRERNPNSRQRKKCLENERPISFNEDECQFHPAMQAIEVVLRLPQSQGLPNRSPFNGDAAVVADSS